MTSQGFFAFVFWTSPHSSTSFQFRLVFLLIWRWGGDTSICCSTYLCIHWLILVCAPTTKDQTHNLGISGQCSNQLSYKARARLVHFKSSELNVFLIQSCRVIMKLNQSAKMWKTLDERSCKKIKYCYTYIWHIPTFLNTHILVLLVLFTMTDFPLWSTLWSNPK